MNEPREGARTVIRRIAPAMIQAAEKRGKVWDLARKLRAEPTPTRDYLAKAARDMGLGYLWIEPVRFGQEEQRPGWLADLILTELDAVVLVNGHMHPANENRRATDIRNEGWDVHEIEEGTGLQAIRLLLEVIQAVRHPAPDDSDPSEV